MLESSDTQEKSEADAKRRKFASWRPIRSIRRYSPPYESYGGVFVIVHGRIHKPVKNAHDYAVLEIITGAN